MRKFRSPLLVVATLAVLLAATSTASAHDRRSPWRSPGRTSSVQVHVGGGGFMVSHLRGGRSFYGRPVYPAPVFGPPVYGRPVPVYGPPTFVPVAPVYVSPWYGW